MKTLLFVGMLLATIASGLYIYYAANEKKEEEFQLRIEQLVTANGQLATNTETLKESLNSTNETIDYLQKTYEELEAAYTQAQSDFNIIRMENAELKDKLERHDLENLAVKKSELIENRINNASNAVNRCFELMTGSPLTADEKKAETARQFNSECPWLWEETTE